jgi:hypothetical protein
MFPDGISLSRYGLLGVAYVRTPFGKKDANDTRNFWTVALDSTTFSGPVGYFLPEFWKLRPYAMVNQTKDFPDFGTVHRINVTGGAYEIDSVPTFNGTTAFRLPKMSMPIVDGRSTLFAGQRGYTNAQVYDPLEAALAPVAAPIDPSKLMTGGKATGCGGAGNRSAFVFGGGLGGRQDGGHEVLFGRHVETIDEADGGTCTWSVEHLNASCCGTMECGMPQYIDANSMLPIQPEVAPASLQSAVFPETQKTGPYDVLTKAPKGGCRDTPGPAAPGTLYCVQSTSPSWVAYRWYKFVDQPGLQQAKLSETERPLCKDASRHCTRCFRRRRPGGSSPVKPSRTPALLQWTSQQSLRPQLGWSTGTCLSRSTRALTSLLVARRFRSLAARSHRCHRRHRHRCARRHRPRMAARGVVWQRGTAALGPCLATARPHAGRVASLETTARQWRNARRRVASMATARRTPVLGPWVGTR